MKFKPDATVGILGAPIQILLSLSLYFKNEYF